MSLTGAAIAAVALIGVIVVFLFADSDRDRDLRLWSERLGIVADTRAAEVDRWLAAQYDELSAVAQNTSVQLYMTELTRRPADGAPDATRANELQAQSGYLRNLLTVVADRAGYSSPLKGPQVDANVDRIAVSGLALLDRDGRILVATRGMPPVDLPGFTPLVSPPAGGRGFLDIRRAPTGELITGFSVPVFAVQDDGAGARPIGRLVGIREIADDLYPRLHQPGAPWKSGEIYLVRQHARSIEFLSPRRGDRGPLTAGHSADSPNLAAAIALRDRNVFARGRDYAGNDTLFAARPIAAAPWSLIVKIDRDEALAEGDARRRTVIAVLLGALAVAVIGIIAAWRHGTSMRAGAAAAKYRDLAQRYEAQSRFLRLVADSQPSPMFIVDHGGRFRFANRAAARQAAIDDADMIGKSLTSVLGTAEARRYERTNDDVKATGSMVSQVHRSGANGDLRVVQANHIPVADGPDFDAGVLVVEQDITAAVREREQREAALRQLVRALLMLVDSRDPYAANQSMQVAVVARAIAEEMGLDDTLVEAAETAGSLMNVGKLLVPSDLLTRPGALADDEQQQIRESIESVARLLADVPFEGPVIQTLNQMMERWDGSGHPRGLSGADILVTARIVAVANAFVAILNPRAWRPGADFDSAVDALLADSGRTFDRSVVAALINRLDNRGGRDDWRHLQSAGARA